MYSELGDKIKLLRKRRGLEQDDLAEVLELSRGQISNLESVHFKTIRKVM
ncbi:MAG: helix-turn-helix transcriptional regulator [Bacilli bacterium]